MNSSDNSNSNLLSQRPNLQVVPPTALKPTAPSVTPIPEQVAEVTAKSSTFSPLRLLLTIGVIAGIGALGFVPVSQTVGGKSEVSADQSTGQIVSMKMPGIVQILKRQNDLVKVGEPLLRIKSEEINKDEAEITRLSEQSQSEVDLSQQQIEIAKSSLKEAESKQEASRKETELSQQQLTEFKQGIHPRFQELQIQQDGLKNEIEGLKRNLERVTAKVNRYQKVFQEKAISRNQLDEVQKEENDFNQQLQQRQYQINAKEAQKSAIQQSLQQDLSQKQAKDEQVATTVQTTQQLLKQAIANVQIRQQRLVNPRIAEFKRVQKRKEDLVITAEKTGTIVTSDLDKKQNQFMPAGTQILEIIDLKKLMLKVQIKPEDEQLVIIGKKVTFRPEGKGLSSYEGTVIKIDRISSSESPQVTHSITVYVKLNQIDSSLLPGLPGYAHIEVESSLLYQKLQREFEKLVPIHKFL